MDGQRLENILLSILDQQSKQNSKNQNENIFGILDGLHPLIKIAAPVFGAFLWFQSNFATMKMYQAQEIKIIETNQRLDDQYKELKQVVEKRHQESLDHSNDNRDRMIAVMSEIKDSLKTLYLDRQTKR